MTYKARQIMAYMALKDCNSAIRFYQKAFDAIETGRLLLPDGKIAHAKLVIEGSIMMVAEENHAWENKSPQTISGNPISLVLSVQNLDCSFQKALDAGATVLMPIADQFYGERSGVVMDPFVYAWDILTQIEDVSFEEMQRRFDAMIVGNHACTDNAS